MITDYNNFYIENVDSVTYLDENIYPNRHVTYSSIISSHELIFHSGGHATFSINNTDFHTFPNSILFIPIGTYQKYEASFEEPDKFIDIHFFSNVPMHDMPILFDVSSCDASIETIFNSILTLWTKKENGYRAKCISLIWEIIYELQRKVYIPSNIFDKIKPAINYIEDNFRSESISVEQLADMCGISYCYFVQIFKKKCGISPKKYILRIKINYSCGLLHNRTLSISQIAFLSGFSDIYLFSRQFKNIMGISPTEYRHNLEKNIQEYGGIKNDERI